MRNPYKTKPNENLPKQKCIFWGSSIQIPFPRFWFSKIPNQNINIYIFCSRIMRHRRASPASAPEGRVFVSFLFFVSCPFCPLSFFVPCPFLSLVLVSCPFLSLALFCPLPFFVPFPFFFLVFFFFFFFFFSLLLFHFLRRPLVYYLHSLRWDYVFFFFSRARSPRFSTHDLNHDVFPQHRVTQ